MSGLEVVEVSPSEIDRVWYTLNDAFPAHAPLVNILFPGRGTPGGDAAIIDRLRHKICKEAEMRTHFVEALLDGHSAGAAIWTELFTEPSSDLATQEDVNKVWPDATDRAFASSIWRQYMVHRGAFVRVHAKDGKPVWVLEWLGVSSTARRKGVGEALTVWGRDRADANGAEVSPVTSDAGPESLTPQSVTEGNVAGLPLYQRCGYQPVARIDFHAATEFSNRPLPDLMFMRRVWEKG